LIDSTEQQIPSPVNKSKRKMYYSDKKKKHTAVKNQIMVNNGGFIIHDYDIYKNNHPLVPKDVVNVFDLGILV
jgi:hypothetical protein